MKIVFMFLCAAVIYGCGGGETTGSQNTNISGRTSKFTGSWAATKTSNSVIYKTNITLITNDDLSYTGTLEVLPTFGGTNDINTQMEFLTTYNVQSGFVTANIAGKLDGSPAIVSNINSNISQAEHGFGPSTIDNMLSEHHIKTLELHIGTNGTKLTGTYSNNPVPTSGIYYSLELGFCSELLENCYTVGLLNPLAPI